MVGGGGRWVVGGGGRGRWVIVEINQFDQLLIQLLCEWLFD